MKKIIVFLFLFISSLYADLSQNFFKSVYSYQGINFNNINSFVIENYYGNPYYRAYFKPYSGIPYKNNFRIFVPKYTKFINIGGTRLCSCGWLDYFVSFNKKPDIYSSGWTLKDIYKGKYSIARNVLDGDISTDIANFKNNLFKNSKTYKIYNSFYLNVSQRLDGEVDPNITDGWLYFATDIRPRNKDEINAFSVNNIDLVVKYYFDIATIDSLVAKMDADKKARLLPSCPNAQTRNICLYIKSFESDGSDNDLNSHNLTASTQSSIFSGASQSYANVNLNTGWNLVGVHYNNFYFSTSNNANISNYFSFNNYWQTSNASAISTAQRISYIQEKNAFWAYSSTQSQIKLFDTSEEISSSISLRDGWNMVAVTKNHTSISSIFNAASCVDAVYKYKNNNWLEWDKTSANNTLNSLSKNDGLWIKATGNCNLSI